MGRTGGHPRPVAQRPDRDRFCPHTVRFVRFDRFDRPRGDHAPSTRPARRSRAATVAAGALALSAALAAPAASLTAAHHALSFAPPRIGTVMHAGNLVRHGYNQDGGNWSGYAAQGSGFSSVPRRGSSRRSPATRPTTCSPRGSASTATARPPSSRPVSPPTARAAARSTRAGTRCIPRRRCTTATRSQPVTTSPPR